LWLRPVLVVGLTDSDDVEKVVKHDKVGSRGYLARKMLGPFLRNGLLSTDADKWRAHRKILSSAIDTNVCREFHKKTEIFRQ
jgi:cytochrome P450